MSLEDGPHQAHSSRPLRTISDIQTLRALGHPVRIALIEELTLGGAMTATQVGERIGESPTTCSFHLRQLARYGFVEEAGGGKGRARPWRMTSIGVSLRTPRDAESELAANVVMRLARDRQLRRYQTWLETQATYPPEWREASDDSEYLLYLTAAELDQLSHELSDLLLPRMRDRLADPSKRPPGSLPVEVLLFAYPIAAPGGDRETPPSRAAPPPAAPPPAAPPPAAPAGP